MGRKFRAETGKTFKTDDHQHDLIIQENVRRITAAVEFRHPKKHDRSRRFETIRAGVVERFI
jgi:hypothetical protein